jgi:hypothetical protein
MRQGTIIACIPQAGLAARLVTGHCKGAAPITRKAKEPAALRFVS